MAKRSGQVFHNTRKVQELVPRETLQQTSLRSKGELPDVGNSPERPVGRRKKGRKDRQLQSRWEAHRGWARYLRPQAPRSLSSFACISLLPRAPSLLLQPCSTVSTFLCQHRRTWGNIWTLPPVIRTISKSYPTTLHHPSVYIYTDNSGDW